MADAPTLTGDLAAALAEVQILVSGDGARLDLVSASDDRRELRLSLHLDDVSCADCVLPPAMLAEVVTESLRRRSGVADLAVAVDDPRED